MSNVFPLATDPAIVDLLAVDAPVALGVSGGKPMVTNPLTTCAPVVWSVLGGAKR